jgi:hypothetical protein
MQIELLITIELEADDEVGATIGDLTDDEVEVATENFAKMLTEKRDALRSGH